MVNALTAAYLSFAFFSRATVTIFRFFTFTPFRISGVPTTVTASRPD